MKPKILTQYASHANTIADTFRASFAKVKLGEHAIEMTAPEDSTRGGLLALQHVTLKPPTGLVLVVGTLNAGDKRAELRSYAHVAKVHEGRFKKPVAFDEAQYQAFVDKARAVLGAFGIEVQVTDAGADAPADVAHHEVAPPPDRELGRGKSIAAVIALVLGVALIGVAVWMALR